MREVTVQPQDRAEQEEMATVQTKDRGTEREVVRKVTVQLQDRGTGRGKVKDGYSPTPGLRNRKRECEELRKVSV